MCVSWAGPQRFRLWRLAELVGVFNGSRVAPLHNTAGTALVLFCLSRSVLVRQCVLFLPFRYRVFPKY